MKKFLLLLGMVTCLIGTAACGKADQVQESQLQVACRISMQATRLSAPAFPAGNRRCPIWVHIME